MNDIIKEFFSLGGYTRKSKDYMCLTQGDGTSYGIAYITAFHLIYHAATRKKHQSAQAVSEETTTESTMSHV